jgi:hypothetical protein
MLLADEKVRCPSCGAKNDPDDERCRTCTRAMPREQMPSQAAFEEALYSRAVSKQQAGSKFLRRFTLVLLLLVGLAAANYYYLGYGPAWAHKDLQNHTESWLTLSGDGWQTLFPGRPIEAHIPTASGQFDADTVLVDGQWNSVLDADVTTPGQQAAGRASQHAMVAIGVTATPGDLAAAAPMLVSRFAPHATYEEVAVTTPTDAALGTQLVLTARVSDGGDEAPTGTVRARLVADGSTTYVIATFTANGDDRALQSALVKEFRTEPAGSALVH